MTRTVSSGALYILINPLQVVFNKGKDFTYVELNTTVYVL